MSTGRKTADGASGGWNPLAQMDPNSSHLFEHGTALAEAMIASREFESHWVKSARALMTALIIMERVS